MKFELCRLEEGLRSGWSIWGDRTLTPDLATPEFPQHASAQNHANPFPDFKLHVFESVASTNALAWELLQTAGAGSVAIALSQTAGRGQRGRQWVSAPGGLYLSLGLTPDLPIEQSGLLTMASAWGIATLLRQQGVPVELKWLNDLIVKDPKNQRQEIQGRKLGGILTETRIQQGRIRQAVIGVGINWSNPVPEPGINLQALLLDSPSPNLAQAGQSAIATLEDLAAITLLGIKLGYLHWQSQGIIQFLQDYEILLANLGQTVEVKGCRGNVIGVTATGELRVWLPAENQEICLQPGSVRLGYS